MVDLQHLDVKLLSDIFQILLSLPGALGFIASALLVLLLWQAAKSLLELFGLAGTAGRWILRRLIRLSGWRVAAICLAALPIFLFRDSISERLQYIEQVMNPAYVTGDTSARVTAIYEAELLKRCDTYETEVVKRRTREIAAKVGCSPLAIYEVAYSECGLNPFQIRRDGIAAGWIQFTRAGLAGLPATLEQVKQACKARDVETMMNLTEAYFVSRAQGRALKDATGVYVATFAPGFVGAPDEQVLYAGRLNPAYSLNSIFDGYYTTNAGQIFRNRSAMDGRITIGELRLHLEAKKARLISKYNNNLR